LSSVRQAQVTMTYSLDMGNIVAQVQERLAPMIEEYQAELVLPAQEAWPVAMGYAPWVEEVWVNYLTNALKYGGRPPRVELGFGESASQPVDEQTQIRFWVRGNSPGIAPEDQARLFTPFTRLDLVRAKASWRGWEGRWGWRAAACRARGVCFSLLCQQRTRESDTNGDNWDER
jgi:two-component system sensor histidine kinase/response regulator